MDNSNLPTGVTDRDLEHLLVDIESIPDYAPGILAEYGGGNQDWWLDYVRIEINNANEYWRAQIEALI